MLEGKSLRVLVSFIIIAYAGNLQLVTSSGDNSIVADFYNETTVSRIAFGSCSFPKKPQPLWKHISDQQPDLWVWLGDAVYADTKLAPLLWTPSPLGEMAEKFNTLKYSLEYKDFMRSGVKVLGVWDDHDYGMNSGGKHYKDRLQAQGVYLDFLDEPAESLRRRREGAYASYSYGSGSKRVKIILLDTRSHLNWGSDCDVLGAEQWAWLERQLSDPNPPELTIVGSGIQVISDIPYTDRWTSCPSSYDRLMWLVQRNPRVIVISGDVHFGEFACLNSTSTGYPLYEVTSSGLTSTCVSWMTKAMCRFLLENILTSTKRTHPFITELNYGLITIHWNEDPVSITVEVRGEPGNYLKQTISLAQLEKTRDSSRCPQKIEDPPVIKILTFYIVATCLVTVGVIVLLRLVIFVLKIALIKIVFPLLGICRQSTAANTGSQHAKHKNNKIVKCD
ncbi:hypothetical protein OS493_029718 [Desmophyllum pertusum]|uniref:PhoD-like phosphatase metallophosphatase domain-containing protein n=1 Tax=Desmophyllum pertusum TaxID=174260 RepID=A0A9W9ZAB5_9CNID|nr:hypothetical protein OS493_029718 [Desmophyllum pertusum]